MAILGPSASIIQGVRLSHQFVAHRPAQVTAHRAGPKTAPENSLAALRLALAAGADFVEIDVQQTADGQVVLLHDRDLRRVAGDPRTLHQVNLADVKNLRLRDAGGTATDERIPTLSEFLASCNETVRLNVELKEISRNPQLPSAVLDLLREHHLVDRAVVTCFDLPPLLELQKLEPTLPVGIILTTVKGDMTRLPVNILSLNQRLVRADVVRRAHQGGMEVFAWTVNDRNSAVTTVGSRLRQFDHQRPRADAGSCRLVFQSERHPTHAVAHSPLAARLRCTRSRVSEPRCNLPC